jgi:hypothetical protein
MDTRGGHPGPSPGAFALERGRVPRRWPWIAGAALLLGACALLVVVRPLVVAADFRRLQSRWAGAVAVDLGRSELIARLTQEATPSDAGAVRIAMLAVQRQEAGRLVLLREGITPGLARDGTMRVLASAERTALTREIGDLRGSLLVTWSAATESAIGRVQALLAAGRPRYGGRAAAAPRPARLTAADGTLLRMRRLLDGSVAAKLLIADNKAELQLIDLRSGSSLAAPNSLQGLGGSLAEGGQLLPRTGYVAVQAGRQVYAVEPGLVGGRRPLGTGEMFPASRPDAVWIFGDSGQGVMVTGTGRRIAGPVPLLTDSLHNGAYANVMDLAVAGGLVVENDSYGASGYPNPAGLWLWNPLRPGLRAVVRGCAHAIAAHGPMLAWVRCDRNDPVRAHLHITDTVTGSDRAIADPGTAIPYFPGQPTAAFSPNGRWLATYYSVTSPSPGMTSTGSALGLVNTGTGTASLIHGAPVADDMMGMPIIWTGDSTRVFFATGAPRFGNAQAWFDGTVPFATYRIGAPAAADVRLHEPGATLLAVIPSTAG